MSEVMIGKDGWLFLQGGTNNVLRFYVEDASSEKIATEWVQVLNSRREKLATLNIQYFHLIAPNKISIYPEFCNEKLPYFEQTPLQRLDKLISDINHPCTTVLINPTKYFHGLKQQSQLYWKTDSHWTYSGCYNAYEMLCSKLEAQPNSKLLNCKFIEGELELDLGGKLNPPVKERVRFHNTLFCAKRIFANELVCYKEANKMENDPGLHTGSLVIYKNEAAPNHQKLVIFGDSFSEYRPYLLTGMLAETFREVHFIWSTAIDFSYLERVQPDIVITEIVERFMPQIPDDTFNIETYVTNKMLSLIDQSNQAEVII
ncbi:MAG: hypothetical protein K9K86_00440 [Pseudomonadales bacterium]|nr:hypothetical protein [Pseudomonadales bacterium]